MLDQQNTMEEMKVRDALYCDQAPKSRSVKYFAKRKPVDIETAMPSEVVKICRNPCDTKDLYGISRLPDEPGFVMCILFS